jgi:serine/threonine protein kinase
MHVDFARVKKIKLLGSGVFGKTYLARYKGQDYALKIQKYIKNEAADSELKFYRAVSRLKARDRAHFCTLYAQSISRCKFTNKRKFRGFTGRPEIVALEKSKHCMKQLIELKRGETLFDYISKNGMNRALFKSICAQLIHITRLLKKMRMVHRDIHAGNIMIHDGRISLIDYGESTPLTRENKTRLFTDVQNFINDLALRVIELMAECRRRKKLCPFERAGGYEAMFKKMVRENKALYMRTARTYVKIFPRARCLIEILNEKLFSGIEFSIENVPHAHPAYVDFWRVVNGVAGEMCFVKPKFLVKYYKWCMPKGGLPNMLGPKYLRLIRCKKISELAALCK